MSGGGREVVMEGGGYEGSEGGWCGWKWKMVMKDAKRREMVE